MVGALSCFAQNSVLSSGQWYKISLEKNDVYKITGEMLAQNGVDISKINPAKIKIYGSGGQVLPQQNDLPRSSDLEELYIDVVSSSSSSFGSNDYIVFYGQSPDLLVYQVGLDAYQYRNNIYEDKSYYFITFDGEDGKRIEERTPIVGSFSTVQSFKEALYWEEDLYNILISGRDWYGDYFNTTLNYQYPIETTGLLAGTEAVLVSNVMGQSYEPSKFSVAIDGAHTMEQAIAPVSSTSYNLKGRNKSDTLRFINNGSLNSISYEYIKNSSALSQGYLDNFVLQYVRELDFEAVPVVFNSSGASGTGFYTFKIANGNNATAIWDVSSPRKPLAVETQSSGEDLLFSDNLIALKTYTIFDPANANTNIIWESEVPNQNIKGLSVPDLLIVSHPDFLAEANELAAHRSSYSSMVVHVVTTEQVFNEFASGSKDVTAIRDCAKYFYDRDNNKFKYLLLLGKGTYDYKNVKAKDNTFVPIYQSRGSLHPLTTYSSDDYFGFLEDGKGYWDETIAGDHTMDIGVGRLPVKSSMEAAGVVHKIIDYDLSKNAKGKWRNEVVFVADDGDNNIHSKDADYLAKKIEENYTGFYPKRLFIDAYEQTTSPGGQKVPEANTALYNQVHSGALIINYTGHGAEFGWSSEKLLDEFEIEAWENRHNLPLFVTATCQFGRHDDPSRISGGEKMILNPNGGGIALVTTSRPVISTNNFELNKAFNENVFEKLNGRYKTLGEVFKDTKNNSLKGASNRNFSLLGDPSQTLAYPEYQIVLEQVNGLPVGSAPIKALEKVVLKGKVVDAGGGLLTSFTGILNALIQDKPVDKKTLGDESTPFAYKEFENTLYQGNVAVEAGVFEIEFIVTKNINYTLGQGNVVMYALSETGVDANGGSKEIVVGGSNPGYEVNKAGPGLTLFMNDTTFVNGDPVGSSALFLAHIADENGINLSSMGVGNQLRVVVDGTKEYEVAEYFNYEVGSYQEGWLRFPINNLEPGKHTIELEAWDTQNNFSSEKIVLEVREGSGINILELGNYPNPVGNETTFYFKHNKTGDDLLLQLDIIDVLGQSVTLFEGSVYNSESLIELMRWDGTCPCGKTFENGIYIYVLKVRSVLDGTENQYYQRLIINK